MSKGHSLQDPYLNALRKERIRRQHVETEQAISESMNKAEFWRE